MRVRGFTMIELTAVLVILAVAAAAVTLRMEAPMRNAQMADVIDEIAAFDDLTRSFARRHDRAVRLVVDTSAGRLSRHGEGDVEQLGTPLELPDGYRIARLLTRSEDVSAGSVSIRCSERGLTPTYAMRIAGPADRSCWVVIAGLTGETVRLENNEDETRRIIEATGVRTDAR